MASSNERWLGSTASRKSAPRLRTAAATAGVVPAASVVTSRPASSRSATRCWLAGPSAAGPGLDQADHLAAAQGFDEMMDFAVAPGAAQPFAIDVHRLALGCHRVEEVFQGIGLCRPAQRVGARRCLPEIEML